MKKKLISTLLLSVMVFAVGCAKEKTPAVETPGTTPGQESPITGTPIEGVSFKLEDFALDGDTLKYNIKNAGTSKLSFGEPYTVKILKEDGSTEYTDFMAEISFLALQNMLDGGMAVAHSLSTEAYKDKLEAGKTYRISRLFLDDASGDGYEAHIDFTITGEGKIALETIKTSVVSTAFDKPEPTEGADPAAGIMPVEGEPVPGAELKEDGK